MTPPLTKLGSAPSSRSAVTIMPVEVVLPCAPATDDEARPPISQCERLRAVDARAARARGASRNSGFSGQSAPVYDDRVGVAEVGGVVADRDRRRRGRAGRRSARAVGAVGSGDADAGAEEHAGDAAHAGAADADEVHGAELGGDRAVRSGLMVTCGGSSSVRRWRSDPRARMPRHPLTHVTRLRGVAGTPAERGVDEGDHAVGAVAMADGCRRARPCARRGRGRRAAARARAAPSRR